MLALSIALCLAAAANAASRAELDALAAEIEAISAAPGPVEERWGRAVPVLNARTFLEHIHTREDYEALSKPERRVAVTWYRQMDALANELVPEMERAAGDGRLATAATLARIWLSMLGEDDWRTAEGRPIFDVARVARAASAPTPAARARQIVATYLRHYPIVSWPDGPTPTDLYRAHGALGSLAKHLDPLIAEPAAWVRDTPPDVPIVYASGTNTLARGVWMEAVYATSTAPYDAWSQRYGEAWAERQRLESTRDEELATLQRAMDSQPQKCTVTGGSRTLVRRDYVTKRADGRYEPVYLMRDATDVIEVYEETPGSRDCRPVDPPAVAALAAKMQAVREGYPLPDVPPPPRRYERVQVGERNASNRVSGRITVTVSAGEALATWDSDEMDLYHVSDERIAGMSIDALWHRALPLLGAQLEPQWLRTATFASDAERDREIALYRASFQSNWPFETPNGWDQVSVIRALAPLLEDPPQR